MERFMDTETGAEFIASGPSRETSDAVMRAIAFFARDMNEAETIWNGNLDGLTTYQAIWENATGNGMVNADLEWGDTGDQWAREFTKESA